MCTKPPCTPPRRASRPSSATASATDSPSRSACPAAGRSTCSRSRSTDCTSATPPLLAIVGASDVARALARLAHALGYRVVISDPREALASRERFPEADELVNAWPEEALGKLVLGGAAAVVIL